MPIQLKNIVHNLMVCTVFIILYLDCMHIFSLIKIGAFLLNAFKIWNLSLLILYSYLFGDSLKTKDVLLCILFIPMFWIYVGEKDVMTSFLKVISRFVPIFSFFFLPDNSKIKILKAWVQLYCITLVPAVIIHILKFGFSVEFPVNEVVNFNGKSYDTHFYVYYFYKFNYIRFCGIYDEPGVIGTFSFLFLTFIHSHLSKFQKVILWITGLFSLSFFFIVSIPLIIVLNLLRKQKFLKLGLLGIVSIVFISVAPIILNYLINLDTKSDYYQDFIFHAITSRFNVNQDNYSIDGVVTNRLNSNNYTYENFIRDDIGTKLFGNYTTLGSKKFNDRTEGGLGLEIYLYQYGIVFFLYTFIVVFFLNELPCRNRFTYTFLSFLLTVFCLYQRPFIYKIEFVVIIYVGALLNQIYVNEHRKKLQLATQRV